MDPWYQFGLDATRWLQENYPELAGFMALVSDLGRFEFYLAVLPLIYWCLHKPLGRHLTYLLAFSELINHTAKHALRQPRPFWLEPGIALGLEGGYGIPSGHVQTATLMYFSLASWLQRRWLWLLAILAVLLMATSRIYLGDHFVHDTIGGLLIAVVILGGDWIWRRRFSERFAGRILGRRLLVVILIPLIGAAIYTIMRLIIGPPNLSLPWAAHIPDAELAELESVVTNVGTLLGLGIGFELERSWVRFRVSGSALKRAGRYLLGIVVTVIIWRGLGLAFGGVESLWLALPLRLFRYFLLGLWGAYYGPLVFVRLRLADADPEQPISLKL